MSDATRMSVEEAMAAIEAIPNNKRILRQVGVRDSLKRCLEAKAKYLAEEELQDPRILSLVVSVFGGEAQAI